MLSLRGTSRGDAAAKPGCFGAPSLHHDVGPNTEQYAICMQLLLTQVVTPQLPQDWPHTIHLLGHLFNFDLCAFHLGSALQSCLSCSRQASSGCLRLPLQCLLPFLLDAPSAQWLLRSCACLQVKAYWQSSQVTS